MFAKKSLGQNFLISSAPIRKMIEECNVSNKDTVLEIGPGKGILTRALLETGSKVIAVEKDDSLIPVLQATFPKEIISGQLKLIHGDVLELNIENILNSPYKLIANIPYYITGEIIRKFLESNFQPTCMALLVQKEVAERIVAKDGKESILSISVKVYGEPKYGGTVKRGLFRPIPNVDSAVLIINNISKDFFKDISEGKFFEIVKKGFSQKRKQLKGTLGEIISIEKIEEAIDDATRRPETLSKEEWLKLAKI